MAAALGMATAMAADIAAADAEDRQGTPEERQACTPDVFRLCSDQIPNADRIVVCLKQHVRDLSASCRMVMSDRGVAKRTQDPR
jgi:hypothetical protein